MSARRARAPKPMKCRGCGCTDDHACEGARDPHVDRTALDALAEKAQMKKGDVESFGFMRRKDEERRPWQVWEAPDGALYAFDAGIEPLVIQHVRGGPYLGGMRIEPGQFKQKKKDAY